MGCVHLHTSYFHCKFKKEPIRRSSFKKKLQYLGSLILSWHLRCYMLHVQRDIFTVYTVIDGHSTGANALFSVSIQTIIKG